MSDFKAMTRGEWKQWTCRENVTLRVPTAVGVYDSHPLEFAPGGAVKRRAITFKEQQASGGAYTGQDRAWLIPDEILPAPIQPAPGCIVVDAGDVEWTIGDVTVGKFGNTHKCIARALAIVEALKDTATLKRPVSAKDAAGRPALATTTTISSTIKCRVQPEDSEAGESLDRVALPKRYTAFLASPLTVLAHDQFVVGAVTYTVTGFKNPVRIWDLMNLDLELVP